MIDKLKSVLTEEQCDSLDNTDFDEQKVLDTTGSDSVPSDILIEGFVWTDSPQGYNYWNDIYNDLVERGL